MTDQAAAVDWRTIARRLYNALSVGPTYPMKFDIHELQRWQAQVSAPALVAYEEARDADWAGQRTS